MTSSGMSGSPSYTAVHSVTLWKPRSYVTMSGADVTPLPAKAVEKMQRLMKEHMDELFLKMVYGEINTDTDKGLQVSFLPEVVRIAKAVQDMQSYPSEATAVPALVAVNIPGKGYRKKSVSSGTYLNIDKLRVGKNIGLIFVCSPCNRMNGGTHEFDFVELNWRELSDMLPSAYESIRRRTFEAEPKIPAENHANFFAELDEEMTISFHKNSGMQKATIAGLESAMEERKVYLQENPPERDRVDFGIF